MKYVEGLKVLSSPSTAASPMFTHMVMCKQGFYLL